MENKKLPSYSVLMSVYDGEKPEYLEECLKSIYSQTVLTDDFVLVCDGKLTDELEDILKRYEIKYDSFHPIRLDEKLGVGGCANLGISKCKNNLIFKMDSDDVALPDRCEKQLKLMSKNPGIDMCGSYIQEFDTVTGEKIAIRKTPVKHNEIKEYSKRRNPFNNQTLVFKKSVALNAGGYDTVLRCEDYDFVVKMLRNGAIGANIPEVLVNYRVSPDNYKRRKNWRNTKSFIKVRWKLFRTGYSGLADFLIPCTAQLIIFILPSKLTGLIYKKALR